MHETLSNIQPGYHETVEIIPTEQHLAVFEELSKKIPIEDESDELYVNGEVIEYSYQESNSETEVKDNPVHEGYRDSNSNTNVCTIHPFNL
ncbi:hypothetical protein AVEN_180248-1 [Araneus ventricosus]|uniref:Uncharacterized protein n=1 Tax=Araneus ventricosus TaxID=182803 RepID=A0A4Y2BZD3_ARAVE|nr:hypothetical protein AVEN_268941-1 [Araneus ventricosus]GBL96885.1 hypothetical protein AVEN_180248-1 [Araneus ventricosus]